jgi:hypothetical protein
MKHLPITLLLACCMQACPSPSQAQVRSDTGAFRNDRRWFASFQPLVLLGIPAGGFRFGAEHTLNAELSVSTDLTYRFINTNLQELEPGEMNRLTGFQWQPELKWYLNGRPNSGRLRARDFRSSLSMRPGYGLYQTKIRNWTMLTDASGNSYQKLLGYTRVQRNLDMSFLWNYKFHFGETDQGFGMEIYMGVGLRFKKFDYQKLSPELDAEALRAGDEGFLSLLEDGVYPLLPLGFRIFRVF